MTEASKLTLSTEELQLVTDTSWILTKRTVTGKVCSLFGGQAAMAEQYIRQTGLPEIILNTSPKISKGENYLQLPWVMLDYPRLFDKENVFAIRTFFWWGNFFSVTLQVSGRYKKLFQQNLPAAVYKQRQQLFICVNSSEWEHHFNEDNYREANTFTEEEINALWEKRAFIKIACRHPLQQWSEMPRLLPQSFKTLLGLLEDQLPMR